MKRTVPYLFLIPAIILLGLTVFFPAIQAFTLSFTQYDLIQSQPPQWVGFDNFKRLWGDEVFRQTLGNTFLYLVGVVPILVIAPLGLAILVNQKLRGMHWFRMAFYTPVVVSIIVAGIAWNGLYASNGLLNQFVQSLGGEKIPWLTSPHLAIWSVMVVTIWKGLGYYMVIYLAGLQSISPELYEAAAIDGSDGWRKHWDLTVPLMQPYLILVAVISSIAATKVFEEVYVMTGGGPLNYSRTVVYYIYDQYKLGDLSYACTIGLVLFLVVLGLSLLNLKLAQHRENYGSSFH